MELIEYPDREMLAMALADRLASALKTCLMTHDRASLCVPGGSSPEDTFRILSGVDLEWLRVDVLLNDERWVPLGHERSNTTLLKRTLLVDRAARAVHVPIVSDTTTPEAGIPDLLPGVDAALPLSVLLLGMGTDGHTASLLPDGDDLAVAMAADAPALVAIRAPSVPDARVTLSARVLADAMQTHVLIMGADKRATLDRAAGADPMQAPIAAFLRTATVHWAP